MVEIVVVVFVEADSGCFPLNFDELEGKKGWGRICLWSDQCQRPLREKPGV